MEFSAAQRKVPCILCLQDLTAAGGAAAALAESSRQVQALRLLYNEELSRASRLAVELTRATAAVDKAAAEEDSWRRQLQKSDSRADNAEGMAEAMKATVRQLEQELRQEKTRLEAKKGWWFVWLAYQHDFRLDTQRCHWLNPTIALTGAAAC